MEKNLIDENPPPYDGNEQEGYDQPPYYPHRDDYVQQQGGYPQQHPGYPQQAGGYPQYPVTTQPVVNQNTVTVVTLPGQQLDPEIQTLRNMNNGFLIFAGFVALCCNIPVGGIALGFATCAQNDLDAGRKQDGKCKSYTSLVFSILGIVSAIVIMVIVYPLLFHT